MRKAASYLRDFIALFDADDDPEEPFYDPVHLGGVLIGVLVAVGGLYWLLWTCLVYEGGLFLKIGAALRFIAQPHKPAPMLPGPVSVFEGWFGNFCALAVILLVLAALHRLYWDAWRRAQR